MPTEPEILTLSKAARRAVDVVDPEDTNDAVASFEERFVDRDEPVTAFEHPASSSPRRPAGSTRTTRRCR
jgi:hypothetical protein